MSDSALDCPLEFARMRRQAERDKEACRLKKKEEEKKNKERKKKKNRRWVRDKGIVEGILKAFRKSRKRDPLQNHWLSGFIFECSTLWMELGRAKCDIKRQRMSNRKTKKWVYPKRMFPSLLGKVVYMMNQISRAIPEIYRVKAAKFQRRKNKKNMCTLKVEFSLIEAKLDEYMDKLSDTGESSSSGSYSGSSSSGSSS